MTVQISDQVLVAYAHCPLKAYLLLTKQEKGKEHEHVTNLE